MEKGLEGVKIGTSYYKLSQFADDTTIIMGHRREMLSRIRRYRDGVEPRACGKT
jgi:hypothetical protein